MVQVDFNLANSFFGVTFCNGADGVTAGSTCNDGPGGTPVTATCSGTIYRIGSALDCSRAGIAIRQAIAHLIDRQAFVTNVLQGQGFALDNPIAPAQTLPHSSLPVGPAPACGPPVPCFIPTDITTNSSQGIGPYAFDPTLPVGAQRVPLGSEPTCTKFSSQLLGNGGPPCEVNVGGSCSWDLLVSCNGTFDGGYLVSAFHLSNDGAATANGMVPPGSPDFCVAAQGFVNAGLGVNVSSPDTGCQVMGFLGFSTGTPGTPGGPLLLYYRTSVNREPLFRGLGHSICQLIHGPSSTGCPEVVVTTTPPLASSFAPTTGCKATSEPGTNCTTQGPEYGWNMYTGGWIASTPDQLWYLYNSRFASDLCGGQPDEHGANYDYLCNSNLDYWGNNVEFSSIPSASIADSQVAMDIFGNHTFTIPVFSPADSFAYLKGWTGVGDANGIGPGNYWSLLNMWNPNPAVSGPAIRWGQGDSPDTLNPFLGTTLADFNVLSEVYDPLLQTNPYNPSQLFGWMANSYRVVTNAQDSNCPTSITRYTSSIPVAGCIELVLRGDISWHDVMSCSPTDAVCFETHSVTASDVKFSIAAFNATGSYTSYYTSNIADVVYNPSVLSGAAYGAYGGSESAGQPEILYVALKSMTAWAAFDLASIPIVPQHIWATAASPGPCLALDTPQCTVDPNYLTGAGSDPVATDKLIGSGPFVCSNGPLGALGTTIGSGCSTSGNDTPAPGDTVTLRRFQYQGTNTQQQGSLNLNFAYFRTNGKFKNFAWADYLALGSGPNNGFGSHGVVTISDVQSVVSCLGKSAPAGACTATAFAHWSAPAASNTCNSAIGPCVGRVNGGASPVSIGTVAQVARWYLTQWTDTMTSTFPMPLLYGSNGNQLLGAQPGPGTGNQVLYEDGTNETS